MIGVSIPSSQLDQALALLEALAPKLPDQISELIEPPRILSEDGTLSTYVGLTIFAKARFTQGVEARRKLLRIVQETLASAEINTTST